MAQEVLGALERIERKLDLVVRLLATNEVRERRLRKKLRLMAETMEMGDDEPPPFLPDSESK